MRCRVLGQGWGSRGRERLVRPLLHRGRKRAKISRDVNEHWHSTSVGILEQDYLARGEGKGKRKCVYLQSISGDRWITGLRSKTVLALV